MGVPAHKHARVHNNSKSEHLLSEWKVWSEKAEIMKQSGYGGHWGLCET